MDIIRNLLRYGLLLLNGVLALLLLLSLLSPYIHPDTFLIPSFLGITFPFWLLSNLAFLVFWVCKWRVYFLISFCALLISIPQLSNYFPLHHQKEVPSTAIKFMTYNCMCFSNMDKNMENDDNILNYIAQSNADIICLQEYMFATARYWSFDEKYIRRILKKYPYYKFVSKGNGDNVSYGIACFSKYPITKVERISFESHYNMSAAFTVRIRKDKSIKIINNHLESFKLSKEDKEAYSQIIKTLDTESMDEVKTNLASKMGKAYKLRAKQADILREYIDKQDKDLIVCGDFNDTTVSYTYHTIRQNLKDAFGSTGFGMGTTFNSHFIYFRIDHILYSPSIKAYNCKVNKVKYSDHYPVTCYFEIP